MKSPIYIRMAAPADVAACRDVDIDAWGVDSAATEEMLISRIALYPQGNFVAIDARNGNIVGTVWTMGRDDRPFGTWEEVSGGGAYLGACKPFGEVAVGINLAVRRAYSGQKVGEALCVHGISAAWIAGKKMLVMGSRIPSYHVWSKAFSATDYVHLSRKNGRLYFVNPETAETHVGPLVAEIQQDSPVNPRHWPEGPIPELAKRFDGELGFFGSFQVKGQSCRILDVLPDYFPDPESCNYGVKIAWINPDHPANP